MSSVVWNGKWTNTLLDYMMDAGRGVFTVGAGGGPKKWIALEEE